ncbi:hypothetical protein B0I32_107292 [Nonomuraea fuscirosea]|uniref:Uncharacterized protein n=1 Tax=Nonomuraea fuscirosea TaxID=1291556 RepID=A0A2T0N177_9ACTN|nr:hypothetical protein [Nonomuraea fuscirosea]PRX65530.1 hypothetical protein B0I32_107292 [Nonomuraea fuscirosea]
MNFCLSDLVPPLRWSDASTITLLTGQPDLPDAWWRSLPMPRVLAAIGPESLGELLTEIALEHWPAASIGDVLPALHVLDPDEADEPAVAIALDRTGSWAGLLALTSRELVDQPFIQARPVLNTLFSAVLVHLAQPLAYAAPAQGGKQETPPAAQPPLAHEPFAHEQDVREQAAREAEPAAAAPEGEHEAEEARSAPVAAENVAGDAAGTGDAARHDAEVAAAQHAAEVAAAEQAEEAAAPEAEPEAEPESGPESAPESAQVVAAHHEDALEPHHEDALEPHHEDASEAHHGDALAVHHGDALDTADEPVPAAQEAEPAGDVLGEHVPEHVQEDVLVDVHAEQIPVEQFPLEPAEHAGLAAPVQDEHGEQDGGEAAAEGRGQELPELIEAAFAGLDDKSWAVAQNRVFTDEPSAVDQLAKLFAVPPAEIAATEDALRTRLDHWLSSDEAAPYRAHLDELVATIGPEAPKERLIGAADWHNVEIRALEVPAWQFVLTTLVPPPVREQQYEQPQEPEPQQAPAEQLQDQHTPDQQSQDQHAPEQYGPDQYGPDQQAAVRQEPVELLQPAFGPVQLPPPPPGPPQFQAFTPVAPPASETNGGAPEPDKPYQPLKDVSQTKRCFRQPDGRWWLRVDVTAEQLAGGECALPTGFASYLGLNPGESRTVRSAAGELTMTWHGSPVLQSVEHLLVDVGAREGGHLFLTLSDEGVLRARHLPVAAQGAEKITKALRLVGYTAPGGTRDQAARVIATRIGMTGPVALPELLNRLRERGDRDLLELLD